ncbi:E3 ubiquitin-protein ligase RFI2-like [Diospyros lotus]|uniref:E3 ubiquitin-protein ligase RFI2-like n=1 Tax=Diospyros lotus TaxID=55363 RepID=UPI002251F34E|nr:E3 ubiquitin-protein ligase RFI2-like [Diospyros lotus]
MNEFGFLVMGSEDSDVHDDGDGGGKASLELCSICLEAVTDNGERSWAKLQCGHQFHLDCIGSAFNIKGAMQCPNCRKIEKGQWLYASGSRPFSEFSMDDWTHEEDLYDISYSEMAFGVHWCPFTGLMQLPSAFAEGEFSSNAYHDILEQHAIFTEQTAVSSASHPCPYIPYFGPIHPSSSNSGGSVSDGTSFNNYWNGPSVPREIPDSYTFPAMDVHYPSWDHHSSLFSTSTSTSTSTSRAVGADQLSVVSVTQRAARPNLDIPSPGSFMHPFVVGHSSAARAGSSMVSSVVPPYPGSVARARDRVQALQAYFQQPSNAPRLQPSIISGTRRSSSHRGMAHVGPVAPLSDQSGGFHFFPSAASGRNFQETENPVPNRFHASWQREHLTSLSMGQGEADLGWGPFLQATGGGGSSIRLRQGSERMP